MDSQDSSAPPPPHHLHHHHHPQAPPFSAHHAMLMGHHHPQIQQQHPSNNSYLLPNTNNSVAPTTSVASNSPMMHQPRFPFNSMPAAAPPPQKPLDHQFADGSPSASAGGWFSAEPARKKRGRPRKYSPDNSIGLGLSPAPVAQISPAGGHLDPGGGAAGTTPSSESQVKRHRGRPPGSGKKQLDALGNPGIGFTPHVITVNPGEDIASKIMAFSQQGPRTVCILSANGAISSVSLRQPAMPSGHVNYEGRYEIISLSGSFPTSESNGSRSGALSVSLAGTDGKVLGGGVVGVLKAASPIQVVVGSFIAEGKKPKGSRPSSNNSPAPNMLTFGTPGTEASPPSGGGSSDSAEDNGDSSLAPGSGGYGNAGGHQVPMYSNMGWPNSNKM
ncbi:AT-hook motif nuclear-localized protein 8-like [Salvia hispanica]|uniref:AT-hook motif nuclear-localized protein 8-like n=1 Tax=Salvia hispanica TaxID=49212 RepID=UPI002009AC13|nr:AT-hook motif nuclear-localized protein 8-like [Salvia hispanica]